MLASALCYSNQDGRFSLVGQGTLRIDGVVEGDMGIYTCRASNLEDSVDAYTVLKVLGKLVIISDNSDINCKF
jgi:hypothetical protein